MDKIIIKNFLVFLATILLFAVNNYLLWTECKTPSAWFILLGIYIVVLALIHIDDIYNKILGRY